MDKQQWIELLKTDVKEFNVKRKECEYALLFLSGADLFGTDLEDANLRRVYLTGANLRSSDLRDANLRFSDLEGAYLFRAKLTAEQIAMLPKLLGIVEDE